MLAYIVRRLVYGLVTLLALSIVVFTLLQFAGNPLDRLKLNPRIQPDYLQFLTQLWGLDQAPWRQYLTWLQNFVTPVTFSIGGWITIAVAGFTALYVGLVGFVFNIRQAWWRPFKLTTGFLVLVIGGWTVVRRIDLALKWGDSFRGDGPVWDDIFQAAGATFRLGFAALFIALAIGIPLGIYQAVRQYSFFDQLGTFGAFLTFSTPIFIVGVGLQLILALYLERWTGVKLFYVAGMTNPNYGDLGLLGQIGDIFQHLTLPALSIAAISLAGYSRFQRASMLEVLHSDYLRTAKAKGLPRRRVIAKHALRNAMIPIVTLVSIDIGGLIGGAIITESIFGWPGVGRLYIDAINGVDYPVVMAIVMAIGIGIVMMNILADILYGVLDPRVRYD